MNDDNEIESGRLSPDSSEGKEETEKMLQFPMHFPEGFNVSAIAIPTGEVMMLVSFIFDDKYLNLIIPVEAGDKIADGMKATVQEVREKGEHPRAH